MNQHTKNRKASRAWEADRYKFLAGGPAQGFSANYANDPKMRLFACCMVTQQEAGFGATLDLREVQCPRCKSPGFNTGWGYLAFTCGAEILTDGTADKDCLIGIMEPATSG